MGAVWNVYCVKHRENFSFSGDFREFKELPPDLVERLRARGLPRVRDTGETNLVERFYDLLSAFLKRHEGCKLASVSDLEDEYISIFRDEESWTEFSIFEDSLHHQFSVDLLKRTKPELLVSPDYWSKQAGVHRLDIERIEARLKDRGLKHAVRAALLRELNDHRRGLAAAERVRLFQYKDVLAMILATPLRGG